jgi:hypothetical protein
VNAPDCRAPNAAPSLLTLPDTTPDVSGVRWSAALTILNRKLGIITPLAGRDGASRPTCPEVARSDSGSECVPFQLRSPQATLGSVSAALPPTCRLATIP